MPGERPDRVRQDHDAHDGTSRRSPFPIEVLIRRDGTANLDGDPFCVPDGEPLHIAVLDALQRHARARGGPVEAVIDNRREGDVTRIEVAPDGSSRILRHGSDPEGAGTERQSSAEPPPAGPFADGTWSAHGATRVPDELAVLVARITRAVDTGAFERAAALALWLREHAARTFGDEHPFTLEAHALKAFSAYRCGNYSAATTMCLELARIRHRQGDPRAHEELMRAFAAWRLIDDPASAAGYGRELLAVWSGLAEQGRDAAGDATLVRDVKRRIHALSAATATPETGAT
ncbi:hypothetical protein [Streptomyces iranensis]|uniref:hypothetical protein n=1 Tax=Streptomyces iranensis TaxID=576784 RepID=UPI0039B77090